MYLGKERLQVKKSDIAEEKLIITSKQRHDIHVGGVHGEAKYQCSQCEYKTVIKVTLMFMLKVSMEKQNTNAVSVSTEHH